MSVESLLHFDTGSLFWEDLMEFKQKEGQKALISLCDSLKAWIDFAIYQK